MSTTLLTVLLSMFRQGYGAVTPEVHYVLTVDSADLSGFDVEIHLRQMPRRFHLAMATHHEYDDRFWRQVRDFRVSAGNFVRTDSALWALSIPGNETVVRYRIQLPPPPRYAHRPFLSSRGGLLGDMHSFMYLVEYIHASCTVSFALPRGWTIATGLEPAGDSDSFEAESAKMLLDCPVLTGRLHQWTFAVGGVPHTVAYLPSTDSLHFDTSRLVNNLRKIVEQDVRLFGGIPYSRYDFLLEDAVYGALEHSNSVTLGASEAELANHMGDFCAEAAHEFTHTWNLMNIQPAGYTELNYGPQQTSKGLWFSEGGTMFYADLLVRRACLPGEEPTRLAHLENLIRRYYADTGNQAVPPEQASLASDALPGPLGDYSPSVHLQGELLCTLLDLMIRDATGGLRSFDDVMRLMYRRFGGKQGFEDRDVEQAVREFCGSEEVHPFFQKYVYEGKPLDFTAGLRSIGVSLELSYATATNAQGRPLADTRVYIFQRPGDTLFRWAMTDPGSCWVRAGLHTGTPLEALDNHHISVRQDFYAFLGTLHVGDTVWVRGMPPVIVTGYTIPDVHLSGGNGKIFDSWKKGE